MSRKKWRGMAILVSSLALAGLFLHTAAAQAAEEEKGPNKGNVSVGVGVEFPTAYFFRGILQEDDGFIAQPFLETNIKVYEGDAPLNSVSAKLGIWNSFQSESPGVPSDPTSWYEADLYGGLTFGLFDNFQLGVIYTAYISPNNSFGTVQEIAFKIGYDDSKLLGPFALSPSILIAVELDGQADAGLTPDEGVYLQLGIQPGFKLFEDAKYPVSVTFPMTLGLGFDDYYEFNTGNNSTFGYFDLGLIASVPLAFIPAAYGTWEVHAGVHFFFLGDNLETVNGGDSFQAVGTFGLSMVY
ncbi:MAG: hypothetical protein L0Y78_01725 [candidate division NC10 bacterium]|nr:hypothetical protein [candidate division NC10 bacterium]